MEMPHTGEWWWSPVRGIKLSNVESIFENYHNMCNHAITKNSQTFVDAICTLCEVNIRCVPAPRYAEPRAPKRNPLNQINSNSSSYKG